MCNNYVDVGQYMTECFYIDIGMSTTFNYYNNYDGFYNKYVCIYVLYQYKTLNEQD